MDGLWVSRIQRWNSLYNSRAQRRWLLDRFRHLLAMRAFVLRVEDQLRRVLRSPLDATWARRAPEQSNSLPQPGIKGSPRDTVVGASPACLGYPCQSPRAPGSGTLPPIKGVCSHRLDLSYIYGAALGETRCFLLYRAARALRQACSLRDKVSPPATKRSHYVVELVMARVESNFHKVECLHPIQFRQRARPRSMDVALRTLSVCKALQVTPTRYHKNLFLCDFRNDHRNGLE